MERSILPTVMTATEISLTPRKHAHAGNHVHELELEALVPAGTGAKGWVVRRGRQADAREEAVFGEDGNGVEEEYGDLEEGAQAKGRDERHVCLQRFESFRVAVAWL